MSRKKRDRNHHRDDDGTQEARASSRRGHAQMVNGGDEVDPQTQYRGAATDGWEENIETSPDVFSDWSEDADRRAARPDEQVRPGGPGLQAPGPRRG